MPIESTQTSPISGRVSKDDYDFLMAFPIPGATTASEKLRHVFSFFRKYHENLEEFESCILEIHRVMEPSRKSIKKAEFETGKSSELVDRISQVIPEALSHYATAQIEGDSGQKTQQLIDLEKRLLLEMLKLFEGVLRMNLTPDSPTYNPSVIQSHIGNVTSLVQLMGKGKNL